MFAFIRDYIRVYKHVFAIMYILLFAILSYLAINTFSINQWIYLLVLLIMALVCKSIEMLYMSSRAVIKYRKLPQCENDVIELGMQLREYVVYIVTISLVKATKVNYVLWGLSSPLCLFLVFLDCITGLWSDDSTTLISMWQRPWYLFQGSTSPVTKALTYANNVYNKCPKHLSDGLIDDIYHNRNISNRLTSAIYDKYPLTTKEVEEADE